MRRAFIEWALTELGLEQGEAGLYKISFPSLSLFLSRSISKFLTLLDLNVYFSAKLKVKDIKSLRGGKSLITRRYKDSLAALLSDTYSPVTAPISSIIKYNRSYYPHFHI